MGALNTGTSGALTTTVAGTHRHSSEPSFWLPPTLAGVKRTIGKCEAVFPPPTASIPFNGRRTAREIVRMRRIFRFIFFFYFEFLGVAIFFYSSLPRVITMEASVLGRVHSMLGRGKRIDFLAAGRPMRLMQRVERVAMSGFGIVKMMAPAGRPVGRIAASACGPPWRRARWNNCGRGGRATAPSPPDASDRRCCRQ